MSPFEDLIQDLSKIMDVTLHPDSHQSCLINFPQDQISIQIDLDNNGDKILIGTQLGIINPGPYRQKMFIQALKVNGTSETPRGILAFSEKNDTLILFQYLPLAWLNGEKLYAFLQLFREHAKIWKQAIHLGDIPSIQEEQSSRGGGMFGLRR